MSSIMGDYVGGFLGASEGLTWNMNAFDVGSYLITHVEATLTKRFIDYQDEGC
jgi:hypothetical protein